MTSPALMGQWFPKHALQTGVSENSADTFREFDYKCPPKSNFLLKTNVWKLIQLPFNTEILRNAPFFENRNSFRGTHGRIPHSA